jgi:micrococcal nuclease
VRTGTKILPCIAALALLAAACRTPEPEPVLRPGLDGPFEVTAVVDGDTIRVATASGTRKVRFLCIDTPEVRGSRKSKLGDEATAALEKLIGKAEVWLRQGDEHQDKDRHGRLLRHVFLEDETHLNMELVRGGWSAYYTKYGPCPRYHQRFVDAEYEARTASRGIWAHPEFLEGGYLMNARGEVAER